MTNYLVSMTDGTFVKAFTDLRTAEAFVQNDWRGQHLVITASENRGV